MCPAECIVVCQHAIGSFADHVGCMIIGAAVIDDGSFDDDGIFCQFLIN